MTGVDLKDSYSFPDNHSKELFSLLKVFYNCCYFTFIVPFRVKWDKEKQRYIFVSSIIQKVVCLVFHLSVFCFCGWYTSQLLLNWKVSTKSFVNSCFEIFETASSALLYLLFIKKAWFDQQLLVEIINITVWKRVYRVNAAYYCLYFFGVIGFIVISCFNVINVAQITHYQSGQNLTCFKAAIKFIWEISLTPIFNFFFVNNLYFLVLAITILGVARDIRTTLISLHNSAGIDVYLKAKRDINLINQFVGWQILVYYVYVISVFGELPDAIMGYFKDEPLSSIATYFWVNSLFWLIAAELHYSLQKGFLRWVESCLFGAKSSPLVPCNAVGLTNLYDDRLTLMAIKQEIYGEPIALSCKFFAITYSFVGSMVGVVITYGIIMAQTHAG